MRSPRRNEAAFRAGPVVALVAALVACGAGAGCGSKSATPAPGDAGGDSASGGSDVAAAAETSADRGAGSDGAGNDGAGNVDAGGEARSDATGGSDATGATDAGGATDSSGANDGAAPADVSVAADTSTPADAGPPVDAPAGTPDATSGVDIVVSIDLGTTSRVCYATTAHACLCYAGTPQATPCSTTSVVQTFDEQGVCCDSGSLCTCEAYACKLDTTQGLCTCASAGDDTVPGSRVAACPTPSASQHCCLLRDLHKCICAPGACTGGEEVTSCAPSSLQFCATGSGQSVTTCK